MRPLGAPAPLARLPDRRLLGGSDYRSAASQYRRLAEVLPLPPGTAPTPAGAPALPAGDGLPHTKGEVVSPQQKGSYFLGALGELVQRMDDPHARYALALPDTPRCRGLVRRLPNLARQRLALTVFFVHRNGTVTQDSGPWQSPDTWPG